eukprot:g15652.t1
MKPTAPHHHDQPQRIGDQPQRIGVSVVVSTSKAGAADTSKKVDPERKFVVIQTEMELNASDLEELASMDLDAEDADTESDVLRTETGEDGRSAETSRGSRRCRKSLTGTEAGAVLEKRTHVPIGEAGGGENGEALGDGDEVFFENGIDKSPIRGDSKGGLADDQSFEPPKFAAQFYADPACNDYGEDQPIFLEIVLMLGLL